MTSNGVGTGTRPGHQPLMFGRAHVSGLVHQQDRNPVLDPVGLVQPGVVEHAVNEKKWPAVGGTDQDAQQGGIHGGAMG